MVNGRLPVIPGASSSEDRSGLVMLLGTWNASEVSPWTFGLDSLWALFEPILAFQSPVSLSDLTILNPRLSNQPSNSCCCSVTKLCPTPWTAARQAPLSSAIPQSLLKFKSHTYSIIRGKYFKTYCPPVQGMGVLGVHAMPLATNINCLTREWRCLVLNVPC